MRPEEAKAQYAQAERLYREEQYAAALEILGQIDKAFPKTRGIMLLQAYCLAQLYRPKEAVLLCDRILARSESPEALDLKHRLIRDDGMPNRPGGGEKPMFGKPDGTRKGDMAVSWLKQLLSRVLTALILLLALLSAAASIAYILYG